jgi:L-threonylcarbamoyladenylate synthase
LFVSTSANISGEPILQFPKEIIDTFANNKLAYYDEKLGKEKKPSTIIDLETKKILRH